MLTSYVSGLLPNLTTMDTRVVSYDENEENKKSYHDELVKYKYFQTGNRLTSILKLVFKRYMQVL